MSRHFLFLLGLVLPVAGVRAESEPERIGLWQGHAPIGNGQFEESDAWLTVYRPANGNRTAIVICPGGGYGGLAKEPEGHRIAKWLIRHGVTGAVLEYRLPAGRASVPLLDAQRALRTVRARANDWNLEPRQIGIMGFSAGGHLASTAGTHFDEGDPAATDPLDRVSCRPDFMVLVYPVIVMGQQSTHQGSQKNLLGKDAPLELIERFSNEKQVTERTPPAFLAHAADDKAVPPENSKAFYDALQRHDVPAQYLELSSGGHGLNGYKGATWDKWQTESLAWLAKLKFISAADAAAERKYPPSLVAPTEALSPEEEQARFHLPPGFNIELVAAEPEIHKPMNLNFDSRGRLYVTSSLEYPFPAKPDTVARDTMHVLSDSDSDGRLDRVTQILDGLNIPIGVTPVADGIIYYSIPYIFRWRGDVEKPDGAAGQILYGTFGSRDTHGMTNSFTRWIDGWIYACHGFANTSRIEGADKQAVQMQSGNTFRMRADGSHVEPNTRGQVNPFGLCFDPLGNLYSADCHTMPVYQLLRGACYESFGKPHDGLGFGPKMIGHNHGSTGIAGVVYYAADHFPAIWRNTVFIGNPVTGRVNHDRIEWHGSSPRAIEQPDFLSCDDPWFRPVDLKLGPDGALYVADFYNCIIGHYEVPLRHPRRDRHRGRIWRITHAGEQPSSVKSTPKPPNIASQSDAALVELLGHPNLTVRVLATEELAGRADLPAESLLPPGDDGATSEFRRAHGLWLIERRAGLGQQAIERLAHDPSRLVRVHLLKALAERADWSAGGIDVASLVRGALDDGDAFVRRAAADALGRHPQFESIAPLLRLWRTTAREDSHLIHVARMALRDHLARPETYARLPELAPDADDTGKLADVSLGVHTPEAADYLLNFVGQRPIDGHTPAYLSEIARYLPAERMAEVYEWLENSPRDDASVARELALSLHRAHQARGAAAPEELSRYATSIARKLLASADAGQVRGGVELARELRLTALHDELAALVTAGDRSADLRSAAIDACVANDAPRCVPFLSRVLGQSEQPPALRQKAATVLANAQEPAAREALVTQLRTAPDRLAIEIAAGLATRPSGAEALFAEVRAGRASPRVLQERAVEERLRKLKFDDLDQRLAELTANLPPADERINQLIGTRREGFSKAHAAAAAGRQVFQKHCAVCHRIGGQGAKIGPDLDGVGLRGVDRLLEDLLDPSRNVDQAFRTTSIETSDGRALSGLALREEGAVLVLADNQGKEIRVPLAEIEERSIGGLSPMPSNVADLVPENEFYQLIAYLLDQRQAQGDRSP